MTPDDLEPVLSMREPAEEVRPEALEERLFAALEGREAPRRPGGQLRFRLTARAPLRLQGDELSARITFLLQPVAEHEPGVDVVRVGRDRGGELSVPFRRRVAVLEAVEDAPQA